MILLQHQRQLTGFLKGYDPCAKTTVYRVDIDRTDRLKIDYENFLRTNQLQIWPKDHRYVTTLRELNNQIKSLEPAFLKGGGLRERMTKARIEQRNKDKNDR